MFAGTKAGIISDRGYEQRFNLYSVDPGGLGKTCCHTDFTEFDIVSTVRGRHRVRERRIHLPLT